MIGRRSNARDRALRACALMGAVAGKSTYRASFWRFLSSVLTSIRTGQVASGRAVGRSSELNHASRRSSRVPHGATPYPRMVSPVLADQKISVFALTAMSVATPRQRVSSSPAESSRGAVGVSRMATASDRASLRVAMLRVCGFSPGADASDESTQQAIPQPMRPEPGGRKSAAISGRVWVARVMRSIVTG